MTKNTAMYIAAVDISSPFLARGRLNTNTVFLREILTSFHFHIRTDNFQFCDALRGRAI